MSCMLPMQFDPRAIPPSTGAGGQLPVSDKNGHAVIITDAEMKPTADNTGTLLQLELKIIDGPHTDAVGIHRLNIGNTSAKAVQIALAELSALFHVVGYLQPTQDVSVLFNKPFRAVVALQSGEEAKSKGYTQVVKVLDMQGRKPGEQMQGGGGFPTGPASPAPAPQPQMAQQPAPQAFQQPVPQQFQQPQQQPQPQQAYAPAQQWTQPAQQPQQQPQQPQVQSGIPMPAPWPQIKQ